MLNLYDFFIENINVESLININYQIYINSLNNRLEKLKNNDLNLYNTIKNFIPDYDYINNILNIFNIPSINDSITKNQLNKLIDKLIKLREYPKYNDPNYDSYCEINILLLLSILFNVKKSFKYF